jgi:hypothetical protein
VIREEEEPGTYQVDVAVSILVLSTACCVHCSVTGHETLP